MGTEIRRSFMQRNPWFLPALLALLIVLIIGGVLLGPKIKAAVSPTATPTPSPTTMPTPSPTVGKTVVVVTATPGGPTVTPNAALVTPSGVPTPTAVGPGSTPLPHATPVPTEDGLTLGMISHPQHEVQTIQQGADAGDSRYTYHLHPTQVLLFDLQAYGFKAGQVTIVKGAPTGSATPTPQAGGRPVINYVISYQGKEYSVAVAQTVKAGPTGIWVIVTILPVNPAS